jgi:hypothetical protein
MRSVDVGKDKGWRLSRNPQRAGPLRDQCRALRFASNRSRHARLDRRAGY